MACFLSWNLVTAVDYLDCGSLLTDIAKTFIHTVSPPLEEDDDCPLDLCIPAENPFEPFPLFSWKTLLNDVRVKPYFALHRKEKMQLPLIEFLHQILEACPHKTGFPGAPLTIYSPNTKLRIPLLVGAKITVTIIARTLPEHDLLSNFFMTVKASHDKTTRLNTVLEEFLLENTPPSAALWRRISDRLWWKDNFAVIAELLDAGRIVVCRTPKLILDQSDSEEKLRKFTPSVVRFTEGKKKSLRNKR